jgi:hypothetical protein
VLRQLWSSCAASEDAWGRLGMIEPVTGTRSSRPAVFSHGSAGGRAGFAGRANLRRSEGPSSPRCQPQQDAYENTLVHWYCAPRVVVTVIYWKEMEEHSD